MKGVSLVSSELSPEISPILVLESERPEWDFLKNEKIIGSNWGVVASAVLNSAFRLRNPVNSGALVVLIDGACSTDTTGSVLLAERNTDQLSLATALPTVSRDTRLPILDASVCIASQANVGPSGQSWWSSLSEANVPLPIPFPFVLTPGHQVQFTAAANNVAFRGYVMWRERRIDVLEAG